MSDIKTETKKLCSRCGKTKPLSEYYNDKSQADGKQRYCKQCMSEYQKQGSNKYSKKVITKLLSREDMTLEKVRMFYGIII
jgi:hypothetical protein